LRLPGGNLQLAADNIQALDMATCERIVDGNIMQDNPEAVAASIAIDGAQFAQVRVSAADFLDIDVQCLKARDRQPTLCRQAEQSRQGQPEQKHPEQHGQQPTRYAWQMN